LEAFIAEGDDPDEGATMPEDTEPTEEISNPERSPWVWLLAVPVLLLLYPPLFNRTDPELFGLPFFYWYQLATVFVAVLCTGTVYAMTRRSR
jgi:hypothetical protein